MTIKQRNKNLAELVRLMKSHAEQFNMINFYATDWLLSRPRPLLETQLRFCGSSCCLAGFASIVLNKKTESSSIHGADYLGALLGLPDGIATVLYLGRYDKCVELNMNTTDIRIGIKALRIAVKDQNDSQRRKHV